MKPDRNRFGIRQLITGLIILFAMMAFFTLSASADASDYSINYIGRGIYRCTSSSYLYEGPLTLNSMGPATSQKLIKGETYTVIESYNKPGSYAPGVDYTIRYYHVKDGALDGWVLRSYMELVSSTPSSITFEDMSTIPNITQGQGFYSDGLVKSVYPLKNAAISFYNSNFPHRKPLVDEI